jgi:hypothetical protein
MNKYIYVLAGAVVIALLFGAYLLGASRVTLGGADVVNPMNPIFTNGLRAGPSATQVVDSSAVVTAAGGINSSAAATLSGTNRIYSPVKTGAVTVLAGTTTASITAAQACAGITAQASTSIVAASTFNLPTAETMFAACLTTNGDEVSMSVRNMSASTTVITAGSASTTINIDNGGTVTLGALGTARITFKRLASDLMWVFVSVFKP